MKMGVLCQTLGARGMHRGESRCDGSCIAKKSHSRHTVNVCEAVLLLASRSGRLATACVHGTVAEDSCRS